MKKYLLVAATAIALTSCTTVSHTAKTEDVETHVYNLTVADMDVSKDKVSKTTSWNWTPLSTVSVEAQKEKATAELLQEKKADVLVEPQYTVKRRGLFRGGEVTVTGYPATYRNFRPMTKDDAEAIATIDGKLALAYPMIRTSGWKPVPVKKAHRKSAVEDRVSRSFLSLVGGPVIDPNSNFDVGPQLGLMYGHYGTRWGWYVKAMWTHASMGCENWDGSSTETINSGTLTFGAIKTITRNFNIFAGVGISGGLSSTYGYDYEHRHHWEGLCQRVAIPFELGGQWVKGHFSLSAGMTVPYFGYCSDMSSTYNLNPFVGIGYTF
ncbi:MAG: hypothetical protein Q4F07_06985 [Bacteroidales bacterium]|nr:hypothetical protein [Bacteroidales bacterium]